MVLHTKPAEICGVHRGPRQQVLVGGVIHVGTRPQVACLAERSSLRTLKVLRLAFFAFILSCVATATIAVRGQEPPASPSTAAPVSTATNPSTSSTPDPAPNANNDSVTALDGISVQRISFEGVPADRLTPLPGHLDQTEGAPLSADNLRKSLRRLYETGLYDSIQVQASREAGGVALTFVGTPRTFIGTVSVDGAIGPTMNTQLERASQLQAGTRFTQAKMLRALQQMRSTLE